ncbi:MAG TPA: hypothetical protein VMN57_10735 [Anaerolineales bacterium]|nr:hypothetical protein [Anaerolineales bacterium]
MSAPTGTPAPTIVPVVTVLPLVTPLAAGGSPFFDSWSPDSAWIAFWWVEYGGEELPGSLAFVRVDSGEICSHPEVTTEGVGTGNVHWQDDGLVQVVPYPPEKTYSGSPCETFVQSQPPAPSQPVGEISPNGRYLAATITELGPGLYPMTTTITDLSSNQMIASISWEFAPNDAVGGGPQWLNNQVYLIGPALNQGFLYYSIPDGAVRKVVTDLLGLDEEFVAQYRSIFSQVDPVSGAFHLLLKWEGGPTPLPLLLYHGELGEIETLPFYSAWPFNSPEIPGFSPDGGWLLLGDPVGEEPYLDNIGEDSWIRPVEPPGSEAVQLPQGLFLGALSDEAPLFAVMNPNQSAVNILGYPGLEIISRWRTPGYDFLVIAGWSPNGSRLAVMGHQLQSNEVVLFVIEP